MYSVASFITAECNPYLKAAEVITARPAEVTALADAFFATADALSAAEGNANLAEQLTDASVVFDGNTPTDLVAEMAAVRESVTTNPSALYAIGRGINSLAAEVSATQMIVGDLLASMEEQCFAIAEECNLAEAQALGPEVIGALKQEGYDYVLSVYAQVAAAVDAYDAYAQSVLMSLHNVGYSLPPDVDAGVTNTVTDAPPTDPSTVPTGDSGAAGDAVPTGDAETDALPTDTPPTDAPPTDRAHPPSGGAGSSGGNGEIPDAGQVDPNGQMGIDSGGQGADAAPDTETGAYGGGTETPTGAETDDAAENAQWWASLPPDVQNYYLQYAPGMLASMAGLPAAVYDQVAPRHIVLNEPNLSKETAALAAKVFAFDTEGEFHTLGVDSAEQLAGLPPEQLRALALHCSPTLAEKVNFLASFVGDQLPPALIPQGISTSAAEENHPVWTLDLGGYGGAGDVVIVIGGTDESDDVTVSVQGLPLAPVSGEIAIDSYDPPACDEQVSQR